MGRDRQDKKRERKLGNKILRCITTRSTIIVGCGKHPSDSEAVRCTCSREKSKLTLSFGVVKGM